MNRFNSGTQILRPILLSMLLHLQCQQSPVDYVPETILSSLPQCGQHHAYYGDLHNHTKLSDGAGSPEGAYEY